MAEGYVKILSSILDSSIWAEPDDVVRVWLTLLAMADRDGYVGASVSGIAARTRTVSKQRVAECLELFQSPDDDSRTDDFDGRRIQKVDRGWLILNYKRIRDMHGEESTKARKRDWWARNRGSGSRQLDDDASSLDSETSSDVPRQNPMDLDPGSLSPSDSPDRARALPSEKPKPRDRMGIAMAPRDPLASQLFDAWRIGVGKPGASMDGQRAALFDRLAIEGVTVEQVSEACRGAKLDDWARNQAKLGASAILGSAEQREKFIALNREPPISGTGKAHVPPQPNEPDMRDRYVPRQLGETDEQLEARRVEVKAGIRGPFDPI
jgi:hypothetical protein